MQGKTVVITGATSGIGRAAAEELARRGARIVFTARDAKRADATLAALKAAAPGQEHRVVFGDLSLLADMKRVGAEIAMSEPKIDVLANNAGAGFMRRSETADGLELTFAVNHMSYFVITNALLDSLKAASGARIISTSSVMHEMVRLDFDNLQLRRGWSFTRAYGNSKLCNILFTRALARRLEGSGVSANAFHPGAVGTRFARNNGVLWQSLLVMGSPLMLTPKQGADTLIYLATCPDVAEVTGRYFVHRREVTPSRASRDDTAAAHLWAESEKIAALG